MTTGEFTEHLRHS